MSILRSVQDFTKNIIDRYYERRLEMFNTKKGYTEQASDVWTTNLYGWESELGLTKPISDEEALRANISWVAGCVNTIMTNAATGVLRLYTKQHNKKIVEVEEHVFLDMWKKVNNWMNHNEMIQLTFSYLELLGNAYYRLIKTKLGTPVEMWVLPSNQVTILPDKEKFIKGYKYSFGIDSITYKPDEIIHFKYPNPSNLWYGRAPLQAAAYASDANTYMWRHHINLLKKGAMMDGYFVDKGETGMSDASRKRFQSYFRNKYTGVEHAGEVPFFKGNVEYKPISLSPKELGFLASAKRAMQEICCIYRVPPPAMGYNEEYARANIDAAHYALMKFNVYPKLLANEQKLNEKLMPMYDDRLFVKYDNPVPRDIQLELEQVKTYIETGVWLRNEVREKQGKDPLPGGDEVYLQVGVVPMSQLSGGSGKPAKTNPNIIIRKNLTEMERTNIWNSFVAKTFPSEKAYQKELIRYFDREMEIVLSNINRLKSMKTITKLNPEHIEYILFASEEEKRIFEKVTREYIEDAYKSGALGKIADLGVDISFDIYNPAIQQWLDVKIAETASEVVKTSADKIKAILNRGIEEGLSTEDMAKEIKALYEENFKLSRAVTIARTEVMGATNKSILGVYEDAEIEEKEWLSARDEKVRRSPFDHWGADGETVKIHQPFIRTGENLNHPGDWKGSSGNIIRCRCTMLP